MIKRHGTLLAYFVLLAAGLLFVWATSGGLPDPVAAEFSVAGAASQMLPHQVYVRVTLTDLLVFPTGLVVLIRVLYFLSSMIVQRRHPDDPTMPERRATAGADLARLGDLLACGLILFMGYEHGFVLYGNAQVPPTVPATLYDGSLLAGLAVVAVWTVLFLRRSRQVPR